MANADFSLLGTAITVKSFAEKDGMPPNFGPQPGRYFVHSLMVSCYGVVEIGLCSEPQLGESVTSDFVDDHHVDFFNVDEIEIEH